jgi:hypothetical protein
MKPRAFLIGFYAVILVVGLAAVMIFFNQKGFLHTMGEIHDALGEIFQAVGVGVIILFWTGLGLGVAYAAIKLNQMRTIRVIGPGKYGAQQALVRMDGTIEHLTISQLDPRPQLVQVKEMMQIAQQWGRMQKDVPAIAPIPEQKMIEAPREDEAIDAVVRYEDVADEVPEDMSLLGIHPSNGDLELTIWEKLKCLWIVGSSSTGKSNTVYGKALEAVEKGALLLPVDQHAGKEDSLARKLAPLRKAFKRSVAITDDEVLAAFDLFKAEFERRVNCPCGKQARRCAACSEKLVLICDEMNRMVRNERLVKPLKEIVAICGEESRGFGMYGWFLSQKCAGLKWLRDSAITVIAHRLTRFEEAKLACNEDRKAANRLLRFPVGRTFVYGVDFDGLLELQQPLYDVPAIVESDLTYVESEEESEEDIHEVKTESLSSAANDTVPTDGQPTDRTFPFDAEKFRQAQKKLLAQRNQNDIICEVWQVQENTRAFRAAKEEFRLMLAYLASMAGEV